MAKFGATGVASAFGCGEASAFGAASVVSQMQYIKYGPGIGGTALANTVLGGSSNVKIFNRFRAEQTSYLTSFRFYMMASSGYGAGTGGTWSASIFADDGTADNFPTGSALVTQNIAASAANTVGKLVSISTTFTLQAGIIYHLVYQNTDANPAANYFSPDYWYYSSNFPTGTFDGRANPRFPTTDWAHGYKGSLDSTWTLRSDFAPILDLKYANGKHQGMSYGEASGDAGTVGQIVGSNNMVRELITVSGGPYICSILGFRILRDNTTGTDPLTVRIEDSGGTALQSIDVPAASIVSGPPYNSGGAENVKYGHAARWCEVSLSATITLNNATVYRLRFSSASTTTYWAWVERRLSEYGYDPVTWFSDGNAEKTTDGSTWTSLGIVASENDLQFYFR